MKFFEKLNRKNKVSNKNAISVQTGPSFASPLESYTALYSASNNLYRSMRQTIPVIDAAIDKIIRLTGNFYVESTDTACQNDLNFFVDNIKVGATGYGLKSFINIYLDSLLTYGNAVGEIIPDTKAENIAALYNTDLEDVVIKKGSSPLEIKFFSAGYNLSPIKYPELILFTALSPAAGEILGQSILSSLPFVCDILLKIINSTGNNFERIANLRYAVTYKPSSNDMDCAQAGQIANEIAEEWRDVMASNQNGVIKDFVAVGDVDIKVIGAENQMINTEIPMRQMLEQIVAKLGIPPFMLGLHWSTTERMSTQQADILLSEIWSYRTLLNNVIKRICTTFLRINGKSCDVKIIWEDINLQDEVEQARAKLLNAQANCLMKK